MRRWLVVTGLVAVAAAALYYSERHRGGRVGPEALLNAAAETQREVSRVPARVTRLSDAQEIRIGNDMARQYASRYDGTDSAMQDYVNAVGRQVAARALRKLDYKFHYIPEAYLVNAFALPGGHIFIGKGLLQLMDTEDELASVLGHEVEHVDHYHYNERAAVEAVSRNVPLGGLLVLPVELFQAGYSKDQELEADRDGTQLAVMAGYSPEGALRMFQAFEKLERQYISKAESPDQELSQVAIDSLTGYFRSHPLPAERERQIRQLMVSQKSPQRKLRGLREAVPVTKTSAGTANQ